MKIESVTIIETEGQMDKIVLKTDLRNAVWPFDGVASLLTWAGKGMGEEWVKENFPEVKINKVQA